MLSNRKLETLKYWAYAGAATSSQAKAYRISYPVRTDPFYRVQKAIVAVCEDHEALLTAIEALNKIAEIEDQYNCGDWDEIEKAREIAKEALGKIVTK